MLKSRHRSQSFIPQLVQHLLNHTNFACKFTELPSSYQAQPYNLAAKVLARGGVVAKVVFNRERNTFTIVKFGIRQKPATKPKTKTTHVRPKKSNSRKTNGSSITTP